MRIRIGERTYSPGMAVALIVSAILHPFGKHLVVTGAWLETPLGVAYHLPPTCMWCDR